MDSPAPLLKVLVVDDEPMARLRLHTLLNDCANPPDGAPALPVVWVGEAASVALARQQIEALQPDALLLDISMPGKDPATSSGLALAGELQASGRPLVVFVTAHSEHAARAFELRALDYLTKPVRLERLRDALQRCLEALASQAALARASQAKGVDADAFLSVTERGSVTRVPLDEVRCLRAELKYVTVRTPSRDYLIDQSLAEIEARFGARFLRIHRNTLVSVAHVRSLERADPGQGEAEPGDGGDAWVLRVAGLADGMPVSRRQLSAVRAALKKGA
jgi:two-component system response regulator AlgR